MQILTQITDDEAVRSLLHETKRVLDLDEEDPRAGVLLDHIAAIDDYEEIRNLARAIVRAAELKSGQDPDRYEEVFHRYLLRGINGLEDEECRILQTRKAQWARAQASGPSYRA